MTITDHNWVTGEAMLWLDNDEGSYHEARRIVKRGISLHSKTIALRRLLRESVPDSTYGVIQQMGDIDWATVVSHIQDDIEEGYE